MAAKQTSEVPLGKGCSKRPCAIACCCFDGAAIPEDGVWPRGRGVSDVRRFQIPSHGDGRFGPLGVARQASGFQSTPGRHSGVCSPTRETTTSSGFSA
eukprot:2260120-Alexandrium_andersonii.AAC.1